MTLLAAGATNSSSLLFLIGLFMVVAVLLLRVQRQLKRGPAAATRPATDPLTTPGVLGEKTLPPDAPRELSRWEVSLHEVTREHTARLDTKIVALQQLIQTAQAESTRLEALLAEAGRAGAARREPTPPSTGPRGPHVFAPSRTATAGATTFTSTQPATVGRAGESKPYDRVRALAAQGVDRAAIARETGLPVGEVDLVLELRSGSERG